MRVVVSSFVFLLISIGSSLADYNQSKDWFYAMERDARIQIQHFLVFTGDYATVVDGDFGRHTYNALTSFQKHREYPQTGILGSDQMQILKRDGLDLVNRVGFEYRNDAAAGISLGVPVKLFDPSVPTQRGTEWRAYDGSIRLETLAVPAVETSYEDLYRLLSEPSQTRVINDTLMRNDFFVISGELEGRDFLLRVMKTDTDSRGFFLSWQKKHAVFMDRVAVAMSNSLAYYDGPGEPTPQEVPSAQASGIVPLAKGDRQPVE